MKKKKKKELNLILKTAIFTALFTSILNLIIFKIPNYNNIEDFGVANSEEIKTLISEQKNTINENNIDDLIEQGIQKYISKQIQEEQKKEIKKTKKPIVELFTMSHCPFGTQIEKGLMPVLDLLGDKIDFRLKFVDYVMHDIIEIEEQLTEFCIDKNESEKLLNYLKCFLKEGDSNNCLEENKIALDLLISCKKGIDDFFQVTSNYEKKETWRNGRYPTFDIHKEDNEKYRVQGSPTLIINGVEVQSNRDSQSLLDNICNAFEEQPQECQKKLSTKTPNPGFGS